MSQLLPIDVRTHDDITVVNFDGSAILDARAIERISGELFKLVEEQNRRKIVLDLSEVRFLSSSAMGMVLNLRTKALKDDGKLVICGLRAQLLKLFRITRTDKLFEFFDSEEKALQSFGVQPTGSN